MTVIVDILFLSHFRPDGLSLPSGYFVPKGRPSSRTGGPDITIN